MARQHRATNAQKMILIALDDGWLLRRDEKRGWCLFQPGWDRPFAHISTRNVEEMTDAGWLTRGERPQGLGTRPAKEISPLGRAFAIGLNEQGWGRTDAWKRDHAVRITPRTSDARIAA